MTPEQRKTLENMAYYASHFAGVAAGRGDASGAVWHQGRYEALTAALGTCGTCRYLSDDYAATGHGFCVPPATGDRHPFRYKLMPLGERCTGWEAQS